MKQICCKLTAAALSVMLVLSCLPVGFAAGEEKTTSNGEIVAAWDFDAGIEGWSYGGSGWEYDYHGKSGEITAENGMLKLNVDYSQDGGSGWSQVAACYWSDQGFDLSGAQQMPLDLIYEKDKLDGSFTVKAYSSAGVNAYAAVDTASAVDLGDGLAKAAVTLGFDPVGSASVHDWTICLIGSQTTYSGPVWLDNLVLSAAPEDLSIYGPATLAADDGTRVSVSEGNLVTCDAEGQRQTTALSTEVTLVDGNADANTRVLYAYLEAVGRSDSVIFGHQDDTWQKAGDSTLSCSDVLDVTGSIAGVVGIDTLSLVGNEYSVEKCNAQFGTDLTDTPENNVKAAAILTNWNIEQGAIVTLSAHMPNFSLVESREKSPDEPSYAAYDFTGYSPNTMNDDVVKKLLPGGAYNEVYTAFLDMIADYAKQVDGTILFRPFHENTGSWFWWGAAFCDAETYKNVYRYTVEYLRDEKGVHNFLYEYGPSSEATTLEEYEARYPGDAYVDLVGFDMYHSNPAEGDGWLDSFAQELVLVNEFAAQHGKLIAVTETGAANSTAPGDNQTALLKSGNAYPDWYNQMLEIISQSDASYFMVWANFSRKDGFYTPYVMAEEDGVLFGHEMLDPFIDFYNDPRSIFAVNQKGVLNATAAVCRWTDGWADGAVGAVVGPAASMFHAIAGVQAKPAASLTGYFVQPVAGDRVLEQTVFTARVTGAEQGTVIEMCFTGADTSVTVPAQTQDGVYYTAVLTGEMLAGLGTAADGTVTLLADGQSLATQKQMYNILEPEEDPYCIDNFESYYGADSLLGQAWSTNKATGSTISITLTDAAGQAASGYGMKFSYREQSGGWAGATISKEVDWSDCNALQFWTIPDTQAQKVVVQLTASNVVYEVYLNLYEDYAANAGQPVLVTIPFAEFCQRDTEGNPKGGLVNDCQSVTSFGLWVNAVDNASFEGDTVAGSIWYDDITAVSADVQEPVFACVQDGC